MRNKCSVKGCDNFARSHGRCNGHHQRFKRHGQDFGEIPLGQKKPDRHGALNPKWRGGKMVFPDGRILIYCPNHPHTNHGGCYVFRYRLVMESSLGRFLLPGELVHHRNGDVTDDRIENLEVVSRSSHASKHRPKFGNKFVSIVTDEPVPTDRKCGLCGIIKPLQDFPRHHAKALGRGHRCKHCCADSSQRPPTTTDRPVEALSQ